MREHQKVVCPKTLMQHRRKQNIHDKTWSMGNEGDSGVIVCREYVNRC